MLYLIKRHSIPIRAQFEFVLVLTYAVPAQSLATFLTPGLQLDEWNGYGFLAVAFVQTNHLRPAVLPSCLGLSFFLIGYRVFCRYPGRNGRNLRGLRIIRSDTNRKGMAVLGNLLTHYNYQIAQVEIERNARSLRLEVTTPDGRGDVELSADLDHPDGFIPEGSPFPDEQQARRFTGPMPFTFDYERETNSIILVQGVRRQWRPRLIPVTVRTLDLVEREVFSGAKPLLASCFYMEDIDYLWKRGVRQPLT